MRANQTNLLRFMQGTKQFIVPIYQRKYNWTREHCKQLWDDILRVATNDKVNSHFIGSIVYVERGLYSVSSVPKLSLIDGQQRLTTLSLLLSALADAKEERPEDRSEFSARKLRNYYLLNNEEDGNLKYKLLLTQTDAETMMRVVEGKNLPMKPSKRILDTYKFFSEQIQSSKMPLDQIYQGINKLVAVDISLNRDEDNPQLIFESLNSTGLDLSQSDLIRNYILMGQTEKDQRLLYRDYWQPMEEMFSNNLMWFDRFMRDFLTMKERRITKRDNVYAEFKRYAQVAEESMPEIVRGMSQYAKCYSDIIFVRDESREINQLFNELQTLKVDVVYPFLMEVYYDYQRDQLNREDFTHILETIISYVFRRAICGIPTNSLNTTFAMLGMEIDKSSYLESVQAALHMKHGYRRFPRDDEFIQEFKVKDIYNFRNRNYLLDKLENYDRKEKANIEEFTIEHILPQNQNLSPEWKEELGSDWSRIQATYLHTIGNLTLTGYNSELSDRPFTDKCMMSGGFVESPILLNKSLGQAKRWNEAAIQRRAEELANKASKIWSFPTLNISYLADSDSLDLVKRVFQFEAEFQQAKAVFIQLMDAIDYETTKHILSVTYRKENYISVNLGHWLVLRFERSNNQMRAVFIMDYNICNPHELPVDVVKTDTFSEQWTGGRSIKLVWIKWDHSLTIPTQFLRGWTSAIHHAVKVFSRFKGSPYMVYHNEELAHVLFDIREYQQYLQGNIGTMFQQLRKRILNLDSSVREEFKKVYIAYKTTTNFVDIQPQRSQLSLTLNMKFEEIIDPQKKCVDISKVGHFANGDVRYNISSDEDLDYAMGLIKQSFEKHSEG